MVDTMSTTTEVDTTLDPFGTRTRAELEQAGYDVDRMDDDLGAVAAQGLDNEGPDQPTLDGSDPDGVKVSFRGMQYNDVHEELGLGQEVTMLVRGIVTKDGTEIMSDNHRRKFLVVTISEVSPFKPTP